jgi:hypothetical protein
MGLWETTICRRKLRVFPWARLAVGVACALTTACGSDVTGGRLQVGAHISALPTAGQRKIMVIPDKTAKIVIRVTGEQIPTGSVLGATLTPEKSSATFEAVPAGLKTINAKCYDADDGVLATGETTITILAGKTATAHIVLQPLSDEGGFNLVVQ